MATTVALMAAGSLVGAGGSLLAADQGQSDFQVGETPAGGAADPRADALQSALRNEGLLALGRTPQLGVELQASPVARLRDEITTGTAGDIRREDLGPINEALGRIALIVDAGIREGVTDSGELARRVAENTPSGQQDMIASLITAAGFPNLRSLVEEEVGFRQSAAERIRRLAPLAGEIRSGRNEALRSIAALQQDFPLPTRELLDERLNEALEARLAEIGLSSERASDQILQAANVGGFNPAGALGRLAERRVLEEQQATDESIGRALQLLSGEVGLGQSALGTLQSSLAAPQSSAQNTANSTIQALLQAGSINSGVATTLSNLQAQTEAQNAQARQQGIQSATGSLTNLLSFGGLASGAGGGNLSQGFQTLLAQQSGGPGAG